MKRKPAVSGMFYPSQENELRMMLEKLLVSGNSAQKDKVKGIIVPHAGYVYSGKVAGLTYANVAIPERIIILGPNHTGLGAAVSVMSEGIWEIPGHEAVIDEQIAQKICERCSYAQSDTLGHMREHSIEVQLPFILHLNPHIRFVPISLGTHSREVLEDLGEAISETVSEIRDDVLIIASSDMSHYVSQQDAEHFDQMAIEKILKMDHSGLIDTVTSEDISMCGLSPVVVMMVACSSLGATKSTLIHYNTSAEVSGDTSQVVGYAGMKIC
ncbi:AmmeMemoRadiSam system protein B [Elusimicrobiota bacterium]